MPVRDEDLRLVLTRWNSDGSLAIFQSFLRDEWQAHDAALRKRLHAKLLTKPEDLAEVHALQGCAKAIEQLVSRIETLVKGPPR